MSKTWTISLIVSAVTSFALLALYRFSELFFHAALNLEGLFARVFILPHEAALAFHQPLQYAFFTGMAFVSAWICLELPRVFGRVAYLAGAVFLTLLLSPILAFCGILFEPFSAVAATLVAGLCAFVFASTRDGRLQHHLSRFLEGRVSTAKFHKVIHAKEPLPLHGRRDLTVLTCRILNHPELSSQMEPGELEEMNALFLKTATEYLVGAGAYLDACNADGVRVLFGMLEAEEAHAADGCRAALELRQQLVALRQQVQVRWHKKPTFGIALATGPVSVGLFGFGAFQSYSAVGEAVDFSRRLCATNLIYGSHVLIGARTFALTKDTMESRPMEMVYAPRMHQISEVYELLAPKGTFSDEEVKARDAFWQGVVSLRKGAYADAVKQLTKARIEGRDDAPLQYFLERAQAGLRDDNEASESKGTARHARMLTAD